MQVAGMVGAYANAYRSQTGFMKTFSTQQLQNSEREQPHCGGTNQHAPTQSPCNLPFLHSGFIRSLFCRTGPDMQQRHSCKEHHHPPEQQHLWKSGHTEKAKEAPHRMTQYYTSAEVSIPLLISQVKLADCMRRCAV